MSAAGDRAPAEESTNRARAFIRVWPTAIILTNMTKILVGLAMIAVGLALVLDLLYLARGSLEMFPTPEREDKVRTVTGVLAALLAAVEIGLWLIYRRLKGRPRAGAA